MKRFIFRIQRQRKYTNLVLNKVEQSLIKETVMSKMTVQKQNNNF